MVLPGPVQGISTEKSEEQHNFCNTTGSTPLFVTQKDIFLLRYARKFSNKISDFTQISVNVFKRGKILPV